MEILKGDPMIELTGTWLKVESKRPLLLLLFLSKMNKQTRKGTLCDPRPNSRLGSGSDDGDGDRSLKPGSDLR
jgi:hypothetical protein